MLGFDDMHPRRIIATISLPGTVQSDVSSKPERVRRPRKGMMHRVVRSAAAMRRSALQRSLMQSPKGY